MTPGKQHTAEQIGGGAGKGKHLVQACKEAELLE